MSTYSVYDIEISNSLRFKPTGVTAGYILTINSSGNSYWGYVNGSAGATGPTGPAASDNKTFLTLTDASTISWTYSSGYNAKVTLVGTNRTLSIVGATNGDYGVLLVTQGPTGVGNRISFGATDKFTNGTSSFSIVGTQSDLYAFVYDGTNYLWNYNLNFR